MTDDFLIGKAENRIASFSKIAILSSISALNFGPAMPINAIALHDDGEISQFKIDHKLVKHNDLFVKGETLFGQCLSHLNFQIGACATGETRKIANRPMLFTAILTASGSAWKRLKGYAAVVAYDINLWLPLGIIFANVVSEDYMTSAGLRTEALNFGDRGSNLKRLTAMLAGFCNELTFFVSFLAAIAGVAAVNGAKLNLAANVSSRQENFAAFSASVGYAGSIKTFFAAKMKKCAFGVFGELLKFTPASGAVDDNFSHKKRLLSLTVGTLAKGAQPMTEGRHNYSFVRSNRQATASLSHSIIARLQVCV